MRVRAVALAGALLVLAGTPARARPAEAANQAATPRIEFAQTRFDFGEVDEGTRVVHRFRFRNAGRADLRVGPITAYGVGAYQRLAGAFEVAPRASGGAPLLVVRPGEWAEIVATFSSAGFTRPGLAGPVAHKITVFSNDLGRPRVALEMSGRVRAALVADPPTIDMGDVSRADGKLPTHLPPLVVASAPGQAFEITKAETNSRFLRPTVTPLEGAPGERFQVTIAVDPTILPGQLEGFGLVLHTTHPKKPTLIIPIVGRVFEGEITAVRPLHLRRAAVSFNFLKPGEERTERVRLTKGSSWDLRRTEVMVRGAPVQASFSRAGDDYDVAVSVTAPADAFKDFRGHVDLVAAESQRPPRVRVAVGGWTYGDPFSIPPEQLQRFVSAVLDDALVDPPEEVLSTVLGGVPRARVVEILVATLKTGDWVARYRVPPLLVKVGDPTVALALEAAVLSDENADVREEALAGLAAVAPERSLPALLYGLSDKHPDVRARAAVLLGKLGRREALPALLRAMGDENNNVALAAAEAVETLAKATRQGASRSPRRDRA